MDDVEHSRASADWNPHAASEPELLAALAESEAEAEAGLFEAGDEVIRELRDSIARMEGPGVTVDPADVDFGASRHR